MLGTKEGPPAGNPCCTGVPWAAWHRKRPKTVKLESERDEQLGYMEIFSGCMTGIRNPRAHEHDWEDSERRALELLTLANHLVERVLAATKSSP
ncbi:MAG: hypothetical protein DIU69_10450 [Bacillota bacterium]|nr:MAG: hypothetical protein DIU69_10450 [Bacillota bacterium]